MSWSIQVPAVPDDGFEAATDSAVNAWRDQHQDQITEESNEQQNAESAAAKAIVASGALGTGWFTASLSGHANAGHVPPEGSSPDATGVYVNRTKEPVPA